MCVQVCHHHHCVHVCVQVGHHHCMCVQVRGLLGVSSPSTIVLVIELLGWNSPRDQAQAVKSAQCFMGGAILPALLSYKASSNTWQFFAFKALYSDGCHSTEMLIFPLSCYSELT